MKFIYCLIVCSLFACQGTTESNETTPLSEEDILSEDTFTFDKYDSLLAKEYGADKYGMKSYVMAFLKDGDVEPKDSIHKIELQAAHIANIDRLAQEGKLLVAGPFLGGAKGKLRGIYIFDTPSIDSARKYTSTDPAIQYGSLSMRLVQWYGSAAITGIPDIHNKIEKQRP
ncbi:MAG: hypothetical protein JKY48_06160 [Flavobacteriales bacterium]|nr:hypothetical protein [Flavobacteriales bacterium]